MAATYEIIIRGDTDAGREYLRGFLSGRGQKQAEYLFTKDAGFSLSHIGELIKFHGDVIHLVCNAALRRLITTAVASSPEDIELEIVESRRVVRASFEFKFKTANRKVAGSIKRMLAHLPAGSTLTGYVPKEIIDPSAEGQELYSPTHAYEFLGSGTVEGSPFGVKSAYDKFHDNEFFHCDEIEIQHA